MGDPTGNKNKIVASHSTTPYALEPAMAVTPESVYSNDAMILAHVTPPSQRPKPPGVPSDDDLASLSPKEAAEWYRRLAEFIRKDHASSLAASMMLHWLDGKGKEFTFDANHIKDVDFVNEYLQNEVRPVFLTEKKAKLKGVEKWGGILPRIKGMNPFPKWDGRSNFRIFYEGPSVEFPLTLAAKVAAGIAEKKEMDLFASLHNFGIQTEVVMSASPIPDSAKYNVRFESWESWVTDKYDWDPRKYLTVPNPDYGNPNGVAPKKVRIRVYHRNAKRVENAKLAAPYDVKSTHWQVTNQKIAGPSIVDATRTLK
jgi:hypothetical protein